MTAADARDGLRRCERALLGCVVLPVGLLLQALFLFWGALWHVQGKYTDLGFVNGGGAAGDTETFQLWGLLLAGILFAEVLVVALLARRGLGTAGRGRHQT